MKVQQMHATSRFKKRKVHALTGGNIIPLSLLRTSATWMGQL